MEHKTTPNILIFRKLIGNYSEEDEKKLNEWINKSARNKQKYDRFVSERRFTELYHTYHKIDSNKAWHDFEKTYMPHRFRTRSILRYVAVFMIPVIGIVLWLTIQSKDIKPQLSPEAYKAMVKSVRSGKDNATLILSNGKKVPLGSVINRTSKQVTPIMAQAVAQSISGDQDNTIVTKKGSEYWLTFEDGTVVHLNYNTSLTYPTHFSETDRTVYLDGEAYFQIAKDSKRPFRVINHNGIIKEYGTEFNVNTRSQNGIEVVLVNGSISLTPKEGREQMLRPGEMAIAKAGSVQITKVDVEPYVAWNNGRFVFEDYTIEHIMKVISQWYNMKVTFGSESIRHVHFTGDVDRYGTLSPILEAIRNVTGLDIKIKGEYIILNEPNN
jgi:transmembrane sensor